MKILLLPVLTLAICVFTFSPGLAAERKRPPDDKHAAEHKHAGQHAAYEKCATVCNDCQRACDMCAAHCAKLVAQGKKEHLTTLRTCQDCAVFCAAAARIVARGGPFADLICRACAEACKRCAEECEKFHDDSMMTACAEECRKCEKACRDMLQQIVAGK